MCPSIMTSLNILKSILSNRAVTVGICDYYIREYYNVGQSAFVISPGNSPTSPRGYVKYLTW